MSGARWGVYLCSCDDSLSVEAAEIQRLARLPEPPRVHSRLWEDELNHLTELKEEAPDFFLVGCSGLQDTFEDAAAKAGLDPGQVICVDLKKLAYGKSRDPAEANRVAARLIRAAMASAEEEKGAPPLTMKARASFVVATDHPTGIALAGQLAGQGHVTLVVDDAHLPAEENAAEKWPEGFIRGRVKEVRGHLGNFQLAVEKEGPPARQKLKADQVFVVCAHGAPPRSAIHTGYHLLAPDEARTPDAKIAESLELVGEFIRPDYLQYDAKTCAAGRAEFRGCGVCIDACPHDALQREGNEIRVDALTCEGCGACVSACPTSAMKFLAPSEAQIDGQLRSLLVPLSGEAAGATHPAVVFHCRAKGAATLRAAGEEGWSYGENLLPVEVPCLRYVSEALMLRAFRLGAAGVALLGCAQCSHGERPLLEAKLEFTRAILDAFGYGAERLSLIPASDGTLQVATSSLAAFGDDLKPSPLAHVQALPPSLTNREMIKEALGAFMDVTGQQPGKVVEDTALTFGEVRVSADGCTLCGACVFVCPTHALAIDEISKPLANEKTLRFNHLDCVACGMCAPACPEKVITVAKDLTVDRNALSYRPLVRDEMMLCAKCGKEYINKKALDAILGRVLSMPELGDTFAGNRRDLLRMCPECRAVVAVQEMQRGWEP